MNNLRQRWKKIEDDYIDCFPPPYGKRWASFIGAFPRFGLPAAVIAAWIVIFLWVNKLV